jgi:hypothetical protein
MNLKVKLNLIHWINLQQFWRHIPDESGLSTMEFSNDRGSGVGPSTCIERLSLPENGETHEFKG